MGSEHDRLGSVKQRTDRSSRSAPDRSPLGLLPSPWYRRMTLLGVFRSILLDEMCNVL